MTVPDGFQFSQSSLQDYVDCRRRFQLRYLLQLAWPAVQTEPILEQERIMQQGAWFHRLVQQHLLGLPAERLAELIHDPKLAEWWQNYLSEALKLIDGYQRFPEISLSAPVEQYRLLAKYDLVALSPEGQVLIIDWKTNRRLPRRLELAQRLQTRVYPYLFVRAGGYLLARGSSLPGAALSPEQIEMIYWFTDFPDQPVRYPYSTKQYQADESYLVELIQGINRLEPDQFSQTTDERRCAFCVYRSFCERGISAGDMAQADVDWPGDAGKDIEIDFGKIAEIEY